MDLAQRQTSLPAPRLARLPSGKLEYLDAGGEGPAVVLLHGLLMDSSLWDEVILDLCRDHRCVAPTLPLGAHRLAMEDACELSLPAIARIVGELLAYLDLEEVILVGVDTGGALAQLMMSENRARLGRVVLASCDAFDNYPPGLTGRALVLAGRLPLPLFSLFMQQLRLRAVRRLPLAFGWLTKRGDAASRRWVRSLLNQRDVRRDAVRALRAIGADTELMQRTAARLGAFEKPALIVWARKDRVMPLEHGRRLVALLPDARLVEVDDSYTLLPLDQPRRFADLVRGFASEPVGVAR